MIVAFNCKGKHEIVAQQRNKWTIFESQGNHPSDPKNSFMLFIQLNRFWTRSARDLDAVLLQDDGGRESQDNPDRASPLGKGNLTEPING